MYAYSCFPLDIVYILSSLDDYSGKIVKWDFFTIISYYTTRHSVLPIIYESASIYLIALKTSCDIVDVITKNDLDELSCVKTCHAHHGTLLLLQIPLCQASASVLSV